MSLPRLSPMHVRHAVKTAVAAVTAYILTSLLHLPQGQWAVISVVLVMQTNLGGSLRAGINRILGTAVGALLGALCLFVFGAGVAGLGLGVGCTILVCVYLVHKHESFRMAGLMATIVILLGNAHTSLASFVVLRFLEVGLGVAVALFVSLFVWPSRAGRQLKGGVVAMLIDEASFYSILLACRTRQDCDPLEEEEARARLEATREKNRALLEEARQEPLGFSGDEHITVSLYNFAERIAEHLLSMEHAVHHEELASLHDLVSNEMDLLAQTTITAMSSLALAIAHNRDPGGLEGLERAVAAAEQALGRIRRQHVLPGQELEVVMRFFSYYYNLREVALELTGMADRAAMLEKRE